MNKTVVEAVDKTVERTMEKGMDQLFQELAGIEKLYSLAFEFLVNYSFQVLGAIIILIIGVFFARYVGKLVMVFGEKKSVDITLRTYLSHIARLLVLFCFIVIALGKFGITIAPFIAALGAITLGLGLALQGLVSNYASGVAIIISRPFKVGDTISVNESAGLVKEIRLAVTIIETEDLEEIMIPNKLIVGEIVLNSFDSKLVETIIGISYEDDPEKAVLAIREALVGLEFITNKPVPQIGIETFGDSSVNIGARYWVPTKKYYESKFIANNVIYKAVKQNGFTIPYPQLDIHTKK